MRSTTEWRSWQTQRTRDSRPRLSQTPMPQSDSTVAESDLRRIGLLLLIINPLGWTWALVSAVTRAGAWTAWAYVSAVTVVVLLCVRWRDHDPLKNLVVFSITGGSVALAADKWLISSTRTLVYADGGLFLADSPGYMPASWAGMIMMVGFAGWYVGRRHGLLVGTLTAAFLSGTVIPLLEACAHYAGWWSYRNTALFGVVPRFIIFGELLIGLPLPWLIDRVLKGRRLLEWIAFGTLAGLWIWASYVLGYLVFGSS